MTNTKGLYNYSVTFENSKGEIRCYKNNNSMLYDDAIQAYWGAVSNATSRGFIITSAKIIKVY